MEFGDSRKLLRARRSFPPGSKTFDCSECPSAFRDNIALQAHVVAFHTKRCTVLIDRLTKVTTTKTLRHFARSSSLDQPAAKKTRRSERLSGQLDTNLNETTITDHLEAVSSRIVAKELAVKIAKKKANLQYKCIEESIISDERLVFFDLETSGLANYNEILEIAAINGNRTFNTYCLPKLPINKMASLVNKITFSKGSLKYRGQPVEAQPIEMALHKFFIYLEELPPKERLILVAHNAKFDARFLLNHACQIGMEGRLLSRVAGFLDTIPIFKEFYPKSGNFKQKNLVDLFLGNQARDYDAHNALADVIYLNELYDKKLKMLTKGTLGPYTFSVESAIAKNVFSIKSSENVSSYNAIVKTNVISKETALKLSGNDIRYDHLYSTFKVQGAEGIRKLFTDKNDEGLARITDSESIIIKVLEHLQKTKK
jgi:DNA polymerase III epsilon subunit-like protein